MRREQQLGWELTFHFPMPDSTGPHNTLNLFAHTATTKLPAPCIYQMTWTTGQHGREQPCIYAG
jgi:hypothetical protein